MKLKYIIFTVALGVSFIGGIVFINKTISETSPILSLKEDEFVVEYGTAVSTSAFDYVNVNQEKAKLQGNPLKDAKLELDVNMENHEAYPAVGTYQGKITYEDDNEERILEFIVKVEDTTKPEIKQYVDLECYVGDKINLKEAFGARDLSDIALEIDDSKVNYNKAGEYDVIVKATDENQNVNKLDTKINIKEPEIDFKLQNNTLTLRTNQTTKIIPEVHGHADNIKYEIADDSIATISQDGKIKPLKEGTTTITASINETSATFKLIVL